MTWNYRLVREGDEIQIASVYYDDQGRANAVGFPPHIKVALTQEDVDDEEDNPFTWLSEAFLAASKKPVVNIDDPTKMKEEPLK